MYQYSWNSCLSEPNGESIFDDEVFRMIANMKVLDVGCGHGEFTLRCGDIAKEVIGFDVTDQFIEIGNTLKQEKVSFVIGDAKDGLPFENGEFDCAYNRKGPTSAYLELARVVKKGGAILGLHPGDESGKELPILFPNLFKENKAQTLEKIKQRLQSSQFASANIEIINSTEYLKSPIDGIKLRCFGQKHTIFNWIKEESLDHITQVFEEHADSKGLPITFQRYIVRAIV